MPGAKDDMECFTAWANIFRERPIGDFYSFDAPESDYLPGYLYLLAATTWVRGLFVEAPASYQPFTLWIKLAPLAGDLLLAIAVYALCRRFVGPKRSLLAAGLTLLNPGLVFVSAVWGQVDSVGVALCMLAMVALVYGRPIPAAALGGVAFVTKPQYGLFLVVVAAAYLSSEARRLPAPGSPGFRAALSEWGWNSVLMPVAVLVATIEVLLRPFSVSLLPLGDVEWSVFQRLAMATDNFPVTSTTALNLWATPLAGLRIPDSTPAWLSLSYQSWGWLLLAAVLAVAVAAAWRSPNDVVVLLWSCSLASIALFMLLTRLHERYLFAAIPLLAAGAVLSRWLIPAFAGVSALYLLNVWASYSAQMGGPRMGAGPLGWMVPAGAVFGIAILAYTIVGLLVAQSRGRSLATVPMEREPLAERGWSAGRLEAAPTGLESGRMAEAAHQLASCRIGGHQRYRRGLQPGEDCRCRRNRGPDGHGPRIQAVARHRASGYRKASQSRSTPAGNGRTSEAQEGSVPKGGIGPTEEPSCPGSP